MTFQQKLERSLQAIWGSFVTDVTWYAMCALGAWLCFYVIFRWPMRHRKISPQQPTSRQMGREFLHSVRSVGVYGLVAGLLTFAANSGWTQIYRPMDKHGWTWFYLSVPVIIVIHDTYFYWTHRLMHHPRLYKLFHHTHHLSTSPTPWAAYAFSPLEALVQAGVAPLVLFTLPVHPAAFGLFMMWQIFFNVLGHCGYEIFPSWFMRSRVGWFLNSITHHAQHHEKFRCNYSLYFNVWDRLMGTNHHLYEERFELVTSGNPVEVDLPAARPATVAAAAALGHSCAGTFIRNA